jgi:hypothetical protein
MTIYMPYTWLSRYHEAKRDYNGYMEYMELTKQERWESRANRIVNRIVNRIAFKEMT